MTKEDKKLLLSLGHEEGDLPQIEEALRRDKTMYTLNGGQITRDEAVRLLGRSKFLAGISRSAFHFTSLQDTENGETICFDSYKLFR